MSYLIERDDLVYTAGIVDGEGSVCATRYQGTSPSFSTRVYIGNTNPGLIKWLGSAFGATPSHYHKEGGVRKPRWGVYWDGPKAAAFLRGVLPYLKMKHRQAVIAISYQQIVQDLKEKLGVRKFYRTPRGIAILQQRTHARLRELNAAGEKLWRC